VRTVYTSVLVGTDGSATAALAVDRAAEVAAAMGARLTIASVGPDARAASTVAAEAERIAGVGVATVETVTRTGDAATGLLELAESGDYDLLVVGNKGMTGATRFLFGSVPNKVSHHASVALLIVRTT
jgi:nucleotide-binding universal stress UspA family protein